MTSSLPADLLTRLEAVEARLSAHGATERQGLTRPDEGTGERWEAGQVWAHLAEFPPYWMSQIRAIMAARAAGRPEPISFGRLKTDPSRLEPIEARRNEDPAALLRDVQADLADVRTLGALSADEWATVGDHPVRGPMTVHTIVERFLVDHLEEHATQLDELAEGPPAKGPDAEGPEAA